MLCLHHYIVISPLSHLFSPQGNVVLVKEVQLNAEIEFTKKVEKRNDELKSKEEKNLESKVATKEGVVPFKDLFRFMDVTVNNPVFLLGYIIIIKQITF